MDTEVKYLLDTNVLVEAFLGMEPAAALVRKLISEDKVKLSVVVVAEILSKASGAEEKRLRLLIDRFGVVNVDREIAELAGGYRKQYDRKTKRVYLIDCLIAATAKTHDLVLVTNNLSDYPMDEVQVLKPMEW